MVVTNARKRPVDPDPGRWLADDLFVVGGTEFVVTADADRYLNEDSSARRFVVAKSAGMVDRLAATIAELAPARIAELGIYKGGSAALLACLARPDRLTAVDIAPDPVPALSEFIDANGLGEVVRAHYGIDQGDREALARVLDADHGERRLDLVVDDASHLYRETRASFEVLFPRLRPGGAYVIEDWAWAHFPEPLWQDGGGYFHDRPALTNLLVEIMMIAGTGTDLIARVTVLRDTVTIIRGPLEAAGPLALEDHYENRRLPFRPLL